LGLFPQELEIALEFRHPSWFEEKNWEKVAKIIQEFNAILVITDTPGRQDVLHMTSLNLKTFVRFVATNSNLDELRIKNWSDRLINWYDSGLENAYFFVHQNMTVNDEFLPEILGVEMSKRLNKTLSVPKMNEKPLTLF
jgi:uncharacterized protein YecE (DUF72 family)